MNKSFMLSVAAVISVLIGYIVGNFFPINQPSAQRSAREQTSEKNMSNPLFQTESATTIGLITSVEGNILTIKDQQGQTSQFEASEQIVIFKFANNDYAPASKDLKSIELNKLASFTLEKNGGKYIINSIKYLPNSKS